MTECACDALYAPVDEALLSLQETADRLGLTWEAARSLCEGGYLGAVLVGREWRVPPEALAVFRRRLAESARPLPAGFRIKGGVVVAVGKRGRAA